MKKLEHYVPKSCFTSQHSKNSWCIYVRQPHEDSRLYYYYLWYCLLGLILFLLVFHMIIYSFFIQNWMCKWILKDKWTFNCSCVCVCVCMSVVCKYSGKVQFFSTNIFDPYWLNPQIQPTSVGYWITLNFVLNYPFSDLLSLFFIFSSVCRNLNLLFHCLRLRLSANPGGHWAKVYLLSKIRSCSVSWPDLCP